MITSAQKVTEVYKSVSAQNKKFNSSRDHQYSSSFSNQSFPREKSFEELLKKELKGAREPANH